ncbi:MAG: FeoA family protein [Armatimonadota bacterium]|nr:ferrous iron transport protein A [Armatimonadota bacterium]MCX7778417.1 ferrous iron transport protein A [Armatimonadota bacterium]MDW8025761.1 FeoA family protein [Armatimonadota bacterium]
MKSEEPECKRLVPLSELPSGEVGIVEAIYGGRRVLERLSSLGITVGTEISVIQNAFVGPVLINVRDVRVAIGRGMAREILIRAKGSR